MVDLDTSRSNYWQEIVQTPTGVTPGTYDFGNGSITVNEVGLITEASGALGDIMSTVVADMTALNALAASSTEGRLVTVLDTGYGNTGLFFLHSGAYTQIGNDPRRTSRYAQQLIGTAASTNIGSALPANAIVRAVSVEILTVYSAGAQIHVQGAGGTMYMEVEYNNPQAENIYEKRVSGNVAVGTSNAQLQAKISNGPVSGSALVTVDYYLPY